VFLFGQSSKVFLNCIKGYLLLILSILFAQDQGNSLQIYMIPIK